MRDGWMRFRLGDIAEVVMGRQLSPSKKIGERPRPYIRAANLGSWGINLADILEMDFTEAEETKFACQRGDVLLVEGGNEKSVGCPALVTEIEEGLCIQNTIIRCRITDRSRVLPEFLYQYLRNAFWQGVFAELCAGTTIMHLGQRRAIEIEVQIPPVELQRRIVDLLASVDAYIESLQQQVDAARTARNAVLHDLLSAGGDDWTEEPLSELLTRSIGGVWGAERGNDQIDVTVVRSTEFTNNGVLKFQTGVKRSIKNSQLASRELTEGDILLEKSGGGPEQPVGRVVFVETDIPPGTVCSNFIQLLSPNKERVVPRFMFLTMWYWHNQKRTLEYQAQTTGIRNLRTSDYLDQGLLLPPIDEQRRIIEIIVAMDDAIAISEEAAAKAKTLRSGLLADLLSGEHEIPESYVRFLGAA
jgi:type I restriction enzyme S subunit